MPAFVILVQPDGDGWVARTPGIPPARGTTAAMALLVLMTSLPPAYPAEPWKETP